MSSVVYQFAIIAELGILILGLLVITLRIWGERLASAA